MPKKLTQEEVKAEVETIGYERDRLEYIGHIPSCKGEDGKWSNQKIIWKVVTTGEVFVQGMGSFRRGAISKRLSCNYWNLDSFRKHYSEVHPELNKHIEVVEYFPGYPTKFKLREISSGKESVSQVISVLRGSIPRHFNLSNHPQNDIPSKLYICLVSEYSKKQGPFITVGVTCKSTKLRYGKHLLEQVFITEPQLNAVTTEKAILNQITDVLGPPHAGNEAWLHTDTNLKLITDIFSKFQTCSSFF
jgi:hypothetical protein